MQQPSVGRIVHAIVDPARNNGSDIAPAIVTRVLSPYEAGADSSGAGAWCVNYRLLYDSECVGWVSSAYLFADEDAARATLSESAQLGGRHAFWPPRI